MDNKRIGLKNSVFAMIIFAIIWILQFTIVVNAYSGNGDIIVHITRTGACYHLGGCRALRSDIEISLEEAYIKGYQPCDICHPPIYTGDAERKAIREKSDSSDAASEGASKDKNSNTSGTLNISDSYSKKNASKTKKENTDIASIVTVGLFGLGVIVVIVIKSIKAGREHREYRIRKQEEYERIKREKEERKKYYEDNYKGKSIEEIVGAPEGITIDDNNGKVTKGLVTDEKPYGDLTVFITYSGEKYHTDRQCRGLRDAYRLMTMNK